MQVTITNDNGIILEEIEIDEIANANEMGIPGDGEALSINLANKIVNHIEDKFETT